MFRAGFTAMARLVFIYNALQRTQRQMPVVATLLALEATTWPPIHEAGARPKEAGNDLQKAVTVTSTTTLPTLQQPSGIIIEKQKDSMANIGVVLQ